jgi:hypothetical protein
MSRSSESVKKWRYACKERIIQAMGGSCCVCGYKRCQSALALHHLDPTQKDFAFGAIRANPKNWNSIVSELRKCVLVCHICHCELHDGIITVPVNAPSFDEAFANYIELRNMAKRNDRLNAFTPCFTCSKLKDKDLSYCSHTCAQIASQKTNWNPIELQRDLKTKSVAIIAKEKGCSGRAVYKWIKKFELKTK